MMLASRAKPPATATDFMGFVNAECNTYIKERTAQIWLHLLGFKWRGAQSLGIYNDGHQRQDIEDYTQCYCIDMLKSKEVQPSTKQVLLEEHLRLSVLGDNSELIRVKQVLEERGIRYSTAPGENGCQQAKDYYKTGGQTETIM